MANVNLQKNVVDGNVPFYRKESGCLSVIVDHSDIPADGDTAELFRLPPNAYVTNVLVRTIEATNLTTGNVITLKTGEIGSTATLGAMVAEGVVDGVGDVAVIYGVGKTSSVDAPYFTGPSGTLLSVEAEQASTAGKFEIVVEYLDPSTKGIGRLETA